MICVRIAAHLCPASWRNVLPLNVRDLLDFALDDCGCGYGRVLETPKVDGVPKRVKRWQKCNRHSWTVRLSAVLN